MSTAACWMTKGHVCTAVALLSSFAAHAAVPIYPPAYTEIAFQFNDGSGVPAGWQPISGSWTLDGGTYRSTAPAATALTIVDVVSALGLADGTQCHAPCFRHPFVTWRDYVYSVRMLNESANANAWIGFVYEYHDANNYYEVLFSPRGVSQLRRVQDGIPTVLRNATYREGGQNVWFDVQLIRRGGQPTTVRVNGNDVFNDFGQDDFVDGLLGLVTHNTAGRFDNVDEKGLYGSQPLLQKFNDGFAPWQYPDAGLWRVVSDAYTSDVQRDAFSLTFVYLENTNRWLLRNFGLRAKLFNPYGASRHFSPSARFLIDR